MDSTGTKKPAVIAVSALISALTWFALVMQFYLSMNLYMAQGRTVAGALTEFFTYFTIQCNIITAAGLTAVALGGFSKSFFFRPGVLTASAVYISIVFLVYNIALRGIAYPEGWARVADELLHAVCPPLFVIFWLALVPKQSIVWKDAFSWLWYPFFYLVYALIRGALCVRYPYFFLNVIEYGYPRVFINIAILMLVFLGFSMLYVFIGKLTGKKVAA
nr:Pr6Pr family membrane protein [Mucilaginibacter sp. L294]